MMKIGIIGKSVYQFLMILFIWLVAYVVQNLLHLRLSAGILGLFLLLALLTSQWVKLEQIELATNALLSDLLLFFIPPVVGLVQYQDLLLAQGWKLLIAVTISTVLVMYSTLWTIRLITKIHLQAKE